MQSDVSIPPACITLKSPVRATDAARATAINERQGLVGGAEHPCSALHHRLRQGPKWHF
jgi:hypothetical protein